MVGHGEGSAGSYLTDPTSPIPSHCASIVVTSTLRVNAADPNSDREVPCCISRGWMPTYNGFFYCPGTCWRNIVKLRCCNHKLEIETGRYAGIDRDLRYCGKCAMNIIGDEYHVFFECSNANISLQRNRFIPTYFRQNRSMFNFVKLLQSVDDISKF